MNFEEALKQLKMGKEVRRKISHNERLKLEGKDIKKLTTKTSNYSPTHADLLAEDWEIFS